MGLSAYQEAYSRTWSCQNVVMHVPKKGIRCACKAEIKYLGFKERSLFGSGAYSSVGRATDF